MAHSVSVSLHSSGTDSHTESKSHHTHVLLSEDSGDSPRVTFAVLAAPSSVKFLRHLDTGAVLSSLKVGDLGTLPGLGCSHNTRWGDQEEIGQPQLPPALRDFNIQHIHLQLPSHRGSWVGALTGAVCRWLSIRH